MLPQRMHSVWLFWDNDYKRRLNRFFINVEEPFRRSEIGFDTQDLTLDLIVQPDLTWSWRDEDEMQNHVREGFFTENLAMAARSECLSVVEEFSLASHPALSGWAEWTPHPDWDIPTISEEWASTPPTYWHRRSWAYGVSE
ncbi:DUF402 domain-containing protein [Pseudohongiella spirulinae]|nr:DUF402 domain-containing protein [Pseudohongiella spirulinae]